MSHVTPSHGVYRRPKVTESTSGSGAATASAPARRETTANASPGQSIRVRVVASRAPRVTQTNAPVSIAAMGTLSQKIVRHVLTVRMSAPYSGPATLPSSCAAPIAPSGTPRRAAGHRSATSARVTGTSPPPPSPCSARPATAEARSWADAVTSEPAAKTARQPRRTGRLPALSASLPRSGITTT